MVSGGTRGGVTRHRSHRPTSQFDHPIDHERAHTLLRPTKAPHSRVLLATFRGRRHNSTQRLEGGWTDGVQYLESWGTCIGSIWGRQASVRDRERVVGGGSGRDTRGTGFTSTWEFRRHFCAPEPAPPALASHGSTHQAICPSMARGTDLERTQTAIRPL